jgi:hypothetical protein
MRKQQSAREVSIVCAPGRAVIAVDVENARPIRSDYPVHRQLGGFKRRREEILKYDKLSFFLAHLVLGME